MQRYKHIFTKLEKHLNDNLLSKGFSKIPVQNIKGTKAFLKNLPDEYKDEYKDYIKFNVCNRYKSAFVNNMMFDVIKEKRKIQKFIKNNLNIQILKGLIPDLYMVGGCIRDIINGVTPKDIDLCTSLSYDEVHNYIKHLPNKDVGRQFLVNIVKLNGEQFEITCFRSDKSNSGGVPGTLEEDSARRSFSVGSLYYNLQTNELLDPNGGFEDCKNKVLRFIGKPKDRIIEDPNRVFRFFRFISEKGYTPDNKSLKACREHFDFAIKNTNSQRILKELERIVKV